MLFSSLLIKKNTYLNRVNDTMRKPRRRSNNLQDQKILVGSSGKCKFKLEKAYSATQEGTPRNFVFWAFFFGEEGAGWASL